MESGEKKYGLDWLKGLLSNNLLISWIKKFGAEGISEPKGFKEELDFNDKSIMVMTPDNVVAFFTEATLKVKAINSLSLKVLKEIIGVMSKEELEGATLKVVKPDYPAFVVCEKGIFIIAPRVESE